MLANGIFVDAEVCVCVYSIIRLCGLYTIVSDSFIAFRIIGAGLSVGTY